MDEDARRQSLRARLQDQYQLAVDEFVHDPQAQLGYRCSSKRVAFGGPGRVRLGSFRRGSDRPAAMTGCLIEHPRIAAAADEIEKQVAQFDLGAFNARREQQGLRYVWLKTDGERVLVTLITSTAEPSLMPLAHELRGIDGVYQAVQAAEGNAIRGAEPMHLIGIRSLQLSIAGLACNVGPLGFLQPNPELAGRCYQDLIEHASEGETIYDLYAGAGVTTTLLRERGAQVTPCESYPESAQRLGIPAQPADAFLKDRTEAGDKPSAVVANPPRGGLGEAVCASLLALAPERISIMSCSAKALRRDLDRLASDYALERVRAYDTLPQTAHLELVAHLVRVRRDG
jgi:23S rRNA (uracil1939-C5)-methyltransferase